MKPDNLRLPPWLLIFSGIVVWILSCTHTANIDSLPEVCFEKEVLPVFQNNCAISNCHDGTHEGFALNNFTSISRGVTPGKPYSSELYKAIISTWGENRMPPSGPLSLENRTLIRVWIEQGANNTTCDNTTGGGGDGVTRACFSRDIQPVLISHCAMTGCHDVASHTEGYIFTTYSNTLNAVSPGNPTSSTLYQVLKATGESHMPPAAKPQLTSAQIDSVKNWISYGALNQTCAVLCDTINPVTFSGTIWPIMQSSCTGCHGGTSPSGGISITGYSSVASLASSGALMNSLKGNGVTKMPQGGSFTTCRIRQFEIWVNNGYLNN